MEGWKKFLKPTFAKLAVTLLLFLFFVPVMTETCSCATPNKYPADCIGVSIHKGTVASLILHTDAACKIGATDELESWLAGILLAYAGACLAFALYGNLIRKK